MIWVKPPLPGAASNGESLSTNAMKRCHRPDSAARQPPGVAAGAAPPLRWLLGLLLLGALTPAAPAAPPLDIEVVPNFHPACCGWLTDWSTERNYCANSYLDHLDRVRDDPNYAFAFSEVPNLLAIEQFEPGRFAELAQRVKEGRVELVNAFFLEPTINLSGGEALVKSGLEGLRWQTQVLGARPRFAWMIDVCGLHEQMAQITAGLELDALFYTRHNPTGSNLHWLQSPDGSRTLAVCPGHYSEWAPVFATEQPLTGAQVRELVHDAERRAHAPPLTSTQIQRLAGDVWGGAAQRTPPGTPVLILGGSGDYSLAPRYSGYPTEFIQEFEKAAPGTRLRFTTPSRYIDAVLPGVRSGAIPLPTLRGGTAYSFNAFWIECPRVKWGYRQAEQDLQGAEMLAAAASLTRGFQYPVQSLYHAWLLLLLNMDRNTLWGAAGGMVFADARSWDVRDRFATLEATAHHTQAAALDTLLPTGHATALFNSLNWRRNDPVLVPLAPGQRLDGGLCQTLPGDLVLCRPTLPSLGTATLNVVGEPAAPTREIPLPDPIETKYYRARIDPRTGALVSLVLKASGRELLGGPANVIVAERPRRQEGDPGDQMVDRAERERVATSSQFTPRISVTRGPLATSIEIDSLFYGGAPSRRLIRFYHDYPRIDFDTELNDIPNRTVVVAEFPLAAPIDTVRRGIPYGFSAAAWAKPDPALHGWAKGIVPAIRWSDYALAGGGGVALLDRGLPGRELTGRTPIIFLLNATDTYYGYTNSWLSGRGPHRLQYALFPHAQPWAEANVPRRAWEFNCPPVMAPEHAPAPAQSFVQTSDNVIVEALRREAGVLELRLAECLGRDGAADVRVNLPHREAALTDLVGRPLTALGHQTRYRFPIRAQQIVTLHLTTTPSVPEIQPLTNWAPLVPAPKLAALERRLYRRGHPPHGSEAQNPQDSKAAGADLERWRKLRLGLFIHWGPVSLKGTEISWSRGGERPGLGGTGSIPWPEYDNLYRRFNPTNFDARAWVAVAKAMGAQYLVFTTKHHDGFCEFDSHLTDYKITNTPFHRDVTRELADACHEAGLELGFYYSPPDWHHPDYRRPSHARYLEYMQGQLRELCTRYGRVDILWFDGLNSTARELAADEMLPMLRYYQPHILVNNRAGLPADFDTPEQEIGHFQTQRPWESCITLGDQWSWKPDDNLKSVAQCLQTLIQCAGGDGNLLFNVGPRPDGTIEPRQVRRLERMGQWLARYGESIYGTRGGPFHPAAWGVSTCRGNTVYLHVLHWPGEELILPSLPRRILAASTLTGGQPVVRQSSDQIRLTLPTADRQDPDTIVTLQLDGPAFGLHPGERRSVAAGKPATASNVFAQSAAYGPDRALDDDPTTRWATDAGVHQAWLQVDLGQPTTLGGAYLSEAFDRVRSFELQTRKDGRWETFARGGAIGNGLELDFPPVTAQVVRLNIPDATDGPTLWDFRLFAPRK